MAGDNKTNGKGVKSETSSEGIVIQRVIREVGCVTSYPVLTKTDYSDWALLMKVKLKVRALWNAIKSGGAEAQEEMMVLDALCGAVPPEMVPTIAKKKMLKEAWDAITTMRVGDDHFKKSTAQQQHQKFDLAVCVESGTIEVYALCLNNMVVHLGMLGDALTDIEIIVKILRSLPPRFR